MPQGHSDGHMTDLEGPDPSCTDTSLVQGFPKGSWCCSPEGIQPHSPIPPRAATPMSHSLSTLLSPTPWGCPLLLPACSLLGAPGDS